MSEISCLRPIRYMCQSPIPYNWIPCISIPYTLLPYMENSSVFCLHTVIALRIIVAQHERDTWTEGSWNSELQSPGKEPGRFPVLRVCYVAKPHRAEEVGQRPMSWRLGALCMSDVACRCKFAVAVPITELLTAIWS